MRYEGMIYRPPSEAYSLLLQVTIGCSHNKCSFCGMYKGQRFTLKDEATVQADIDYAARHFPHAKRLFLLRREQHGYRQRQRQSHSHRTRRSRIRPPSKRKRGIGRAAPWCRPRTWCHQSRGE